MKKEIRIGTWFTVDENFIEMAKDNAIDMEQTLRDALMEQLEGMVFGMTSELSLMIRDTETNEVDWHAVDFPLVIQTVESEGIELDYIPEEV